MFKLLPGKRKMTESKALLEKHLTPEQRKTLNKHGYIDIKHKSGKTYRLLTNAAIVKVYGGACDARLVHLFPEISWSQDDNAHNYIARNVWAKGTNHKGMEEYSMLLALKMHVEMSIPAKIMGCMTHASKARVDAL
jgi:hypothetical protein